jgi:hypothetical protein
VLLPPQPILQSVFGAVTAPSTRLSPQTVKGSTSLVRCNNRSTTIRTTLHTEFRPGEGEVLGGARGNATLDCQSLVIRKLRLEYTSVRVVPESFPVLEFILPELERTYTQHALYDQPVGRPASLGKTGAPPPPPPPFLIGGRLVPV